MNRILYLSILVAGLCFAVQSCAKQGYPSGGPKDETPPVVLGTDPSNGSLNFAAKEFVIHFDEYVVMKDQGGVLISPTMAKKPEFKTKGHGLVVKIKDTLQPATTYLFQFKNAIADFNEGNFLPSFEYVFSTGNSIDSMTIRGRVEDAFTRKPADEKVSVLAYARSQMADTLGDSIVAKVQPMYMTRLDKEGCFELNHLREGKYLLLAIEDGDKNLHLSDGEAVAFLDTLVTAWKMPPKPVAKDTNVSPDTNLSPDTNVSTEIIKDTAASVSREIIKDTVADSTLTDTLQGRRLTMRLSLLKKEVQRISKSNFIGEGRVEIITTVPLSPHYSLRRLPGSKPTGEPQDDMPLWHQRGQKGDTLSVWLADKTCDSVSLLLKDTTGLNDTLLLKRKATPANKPMPKGMGLKVPKANVLRNAVAAKHPYFDTLWLKFDNPAAGVCSPWRHTDTLASNPLDSAVTVTVLSDSSQSHCGIRLLKDPAMAPAVGLRAYIVFTGKPGEKYLFKVPAGLFHDIWNNENDSLTISTEYTKPENYGNIAITLLSPSSAPTPTPDSSQDSASHAGSQRFPRLLVQLTNEKGDMVLQQIADRPGKLTFQHLKGGKYGLRAIVDTDGNGAWTPGDYWQHRQPEKVLLFEKTLELRENWDMEEKWTIDLNL